MNLERSFQNSDHPITFYISESSLAGFPPHLSEFTDLFHQDSATETDLATTSAEVVESNIEMLRLMWDKCYFVVSLEAHLGVMDV